METIKRINREALSAAQSSTGMSSKGSYRSYGSDNTQMYVYLGALAAAVASYFLLQNYQPNFVMTTDGNGMKMFDQTRAMILSAVVGLVVVVGYHMSKN